MDHDSRHHLPKVGHDRSNSCVFNAAHEYRCGLRIPYCAEVVLRVDAGEVKGTIRNIGSGGFFVDTQTHLRVGLKLELDFHFRFGSHTMKLMGQVVRKSSNGVGIKIL